MDNLVAGRQSLFFDQVGPILYIWTLILYSFCLSVNLVYFPDADFLSNSRGPSGGQHTWCSEARNFILAESPLAITNVEIRKEAPSINILTLVRIVVNF